MNKYYYINISNNDMMPYKRIIKNTESPGEIPIDYIPDAFIYAAKKGKEYYILYILSNHFDELDQTDYDFAFTNACYNGNLSIAKMLLRKCSESAIIEGYKWADCKNFLEMKKFLKSIYTHS